VQNQERTGYSLAPFLGLQVAALSAGAAAIHFAVISEHFEEYWVFGAFFLVVAWFQAASSIAIVARPDRRVLLAIAVVNAVVILIWIWSRTAGLPIGPEAGEPEVVGAPDVLSTVLEALLLAWALGMLSPRIVSKAASRGLGILTTAIVWACVVAATALVFFSETGEAMPR
jgi:hypothetical protein